METPDLTTSLHILGNAPMGIVITDLNGKILWYNQKIDAWLGGVSKAYLGRDESSLVENGSADFALNSGPYQLQSGQVILRCPLAPQNGHQAVCYLDVSEQESLRHGRTLLAQQLEEYTRIEPISGLLNERSIVTELDSLVTRSRRYNNPLTVVLMEITTLDTIIDSVGQVAADRIVLSVSQALRDQMRWADLLGRMDNGQFVLVLPETETDAAEVLANKIIGRLRRLKVEIDDSVSCIPEASFGIVGWRKGEDPNKLMSLAAQALSGAKKMGPYSVKID